MGVVEWFLQNCLVGLQLGLAAVLPLLVDWQLMWMVLLLLVVPWAAEATLPETLPATERPLATLAVSAVVPVV